MGLFASLNIFKHLLSVLFLNYLTYRYLSFSSVIKQNFYHVVSIVWCALQLIAWEDVLLIMGERPKTWVGLDPTYLKTALDATICHYIPLCIYVPLFIVYLAAHCVWNKPATLSLAPVWWRVITAVLLGKINYFSNRFISSALNEVNHSLMLGRDVSVTEIGSCFFPDSYI